MQLRGLGDDSTDFSSPDYSLTGGSTSPNSSAPANYSLTAPSSGSALGPAISGPPDSAAPPSSSGVGSGLNWTDIANALVKVIPAAVTGAVVYNKATKPATTISPSMPYAYNPVYSGYYGQPVPAGYTVSPVTGALTPDTSSSMLGYVALGIAALFVLKGLRG
jgi:hypothetical protein